MAAALRPGCAKAPLTAVAIASAQNLTQQIDADQMPFNAAFLAYWQWLEKRAAQLQQPTNVILPREWVTFAHAQIARINQATDAAKADAPPSTATPAR